MTLAKILTCKEALGSNESEPATNIDVTNRETLQSVNIERHYWQNNTYHDLSPFISSQSPLEMVLPTSRRPNSRQLAQTGRQAKVTQNTEDETIKESHGATGWENNRQASS
jgi:hypothetical protein